MMAAKDEDAVGQKPEKVAEQHSPPPRSPGTTCEEGSDRCRS